MSLTVRRLITALKKMPQDARVVVCAHDQNDEAGEYDGFPWRVDRAPKALREHGAGVVIYL